MIAKYWKREMSFGLRKCGGAN